MPSLQMRKLRPREVKMHSQKVGARIRTQASSSTALSPVVEAATAQQTPPALILGPPPSAPPLTSLVVSMAVSTAQFSDSSAASTGR